MRSAGDARSLEGRGDQPMRFGLDFEVKQSPSERDGVNVCSVSQFAFLRPQQAGAPRPAEKAERLVFANPRQLFLQQIHQRRARQ